MTIRDLIADNVSRFERSTDESVVSRVLAEIPAEAWQEFVRPLIAAEVARVRRQRVLSVEKAAVVPSPDFRSDHASVDTQNHIGGAESPTRQRGTGRTVQVVGGFNPDPEVRRLLNETFALGDGSKVRWGQATRAEHSQRIIMLTKQSAGIEATAERHRNAIAMLDFAGAVCLDDAYRAAAA